MKCGGRIEVCYNVQTAVDAKHKLIVAEDVTNAAGDRDQLSPMARAAQAGLGGATPVVVADQGYYHGTEIKTCLDAGLTPLVPRPLTSANEARGLFTKDDFRYEAAADAYRGPAGETLTYRTTTVELGRTLKNYRTSACGRCALKPRCTRNRDGRKLTRWVDEQLLEAMERRLARDRVLFAQRKTLSEHPFGTRKRGMDQGYFLLKGLRKVRGEFSLTVLAYNLKRVLNVVGVPRLIEALASGLSTPLLPPQTPPGALMSSSHASPNRSSPWIAAPRSLRPLASQSQRVFTRPQRGLGSPSRSLACSGVPERGLNSFRNRCDHSVWSRIVPPL